MVLASINPPEAALRWAAAVAGARRATASQRLLGGSHAVTHLIRTSSPTAEMVMRRFPPGDDAALREARVLTALEGLDGLAPRLVAADPSGETFGEPTVLLSRLGGAANIRPRNIDAWTKSLANALARVHSHAPRGLSALRECASAEAPVASLAGPAGPVVLSEWEQLRSAGHVLTHFDFWSGNTLWTGHVLTGIVDWSGAGLAPPGFDLGWCRLDLALLHGANQADEFLRAYGTATGRPLERVALWDLYACARSHDDVAGWVENYRRLGRTDLTSAVLRERHEGWTQRALRVLNQS